MLGNLAISWCFSIKIEFISILLNEATFVSHVHSDFPWESHRRNAGKAGSDEKKSRSLIFDEEMDGTRAYNAPILFGTPLPRIGTRGRAKKGGEF
jgi:hypothetical protein